MRAGDYSTMDCGDGELLSSQPSACKRDADGRPDLTRDCGYIRVGEFIATAPVSMPVSPAFAHKLSWGVIEAQHQGIMDQLMAQRYAAMERLVVCPAEEESSLSLEPTAMAGAAGIAVVAVLFGLLLYWSYWLSSLKLLSRGRPLPAPTVALEAEPTVALDAEPKVALDAEQQVEEPPP